MFIELRLGGTIMSDSIFIPYQIRMLNLMAQVKSDETMDEINEILSDYFARRAEVAIDKLWKDIKINDQVIEEWKNEHMRTPYHK